ncbi:hypothetical protein AKJ41_03225 [candidate division MSBL1 archaeon SCGC-AAA259O05]|uniref:Uncharacterized protein n=1 Tax=candidate division MSBL1 archaeon SCGC-AAA259O05 TaxID=1698271 RepID=A0A133V3H2_9EURY|nr:hypothetical protein AKJ41_03225 [candidate division MSBL1 archaeon SCGC-AAA259O05]
MTRFSEKDNPRKRWECDACFSVYKGYALSKNGGLCLECGCDCFTEVDSNESVWKLESEE